MIVSFYILGICCVDFALFVGDTGKIVVPKNPQALAEGMIEILSLSLSEKGELGRRARRRIIENYDIGKITCQYEDLYETVLLNTLD